MEKTIMVVGGPFSQQVDPVLQLVPTGRGELAARIAGACETHFRHVKRIGNFPGGMPCTFEQLQEQIEQLDTDVLIFLPHLPNVLLEPSPTKIRLQEGQSGTIQIRAAPKIVQHVKRMHPEVLLVLFKLADQATSRVEIVKWMLDLHAGLAVYSRLGDSGHYYIIDALANEVCVSKEELPAALVETISHFLEAIRRRSVRKGLAVPAVPYLDKLVAFSRKQEQPTHD